MYVCIRHTTAHTTHTCSCKIYCTRTIYSTPPHSTLHTLVDGGGQLADMFTTVAAGLAGTTPHMTSATIIALSRLMWEFKGKMHACECVWVHVKV